MRCKIGILTKNSCEAVLKNAVVKIHDIGFINEGEVEFKNFDSLLYALANDEVQVGIGHLCEFPLFSESDDVVVAALSGRDKYGFQMIQSYRQSNHFSSHEDAKKQSTLVHYRLLFEQLQQIFEKESIQLQYFQEDEILDLISNDESVQVVVDHNFATSEKKHLKNIISKPLHPSELTGKPGMGVIAFLTHKESYDFRKELKKVHNPILMRETNVERTVQKLMGSDMKDNLGVFCSMDKNRHYRVTAVALDPYRRVNIVQSTFVGLAEKVVDLLQGKA